MSMAFQSNVLRDGEWVLETVNVQEALKASTAPKPATEPLPEVPICGILSRTVIESPVVHWALPVRLRSQNSNDIAFIGDRFVQISELRDDGQLHEVIRKSDFDYRIRNAVVLGPPSHDNSNAEPLNSIKTEDLDVSMQDAAAAPGNHEPRSLPPQLLVLMLETGEAIFLFLESTNGSLNFVFSKQSSPKNLKFLGFHLSVDPTSRYLAAAPAEGAFIVYELASMEAMNSEYMRQGSFKPVRSVHIRTTQGVIHKMEFLHPRPQDHDFQIILLLIIARYEPSRTVKTSRMIYYEWEKGENLKSVFEPEKRGTRLPDAYKMPLLLVPLRFNTAFFAVSENSIGIVKCALEDLPQFEQLQTNVPGPTELHHGNQQPLWTAWARPFRLKSYFEKTDIIYLAREDGVVIHVEIDASELMPSVTNLESIKANISTAFTTAYDRFADVLIVGGDSGSGGIWKLPARSDLEHVSTIPNWSPVVDMTTTDEISSWTGESPMEAVTPRNSTSQSLAKPDRIFCASGRGLKSSLTELRWGIQARIGLVLDLDYGEPVRQSWMFPMEIHGERGFYALLSLPHSSYVFHISGSFDAATALTPEASPFDTMSRTICAVQNEQGTVVQVTETSITLVVPSQSSRRPHHEILGIHGVVVENAFCNGDLVVVSSHQDEVSRLHVLQLDQMNITLVNSWEANGEVSCISILTVSGQMLIVVGSTMDASARITIYSANGHSVMSKTLSVNHGGDMGEAHAQIEAFTSVSALTEDVDDAVIVFGTRSGHLVTGTVGRQDCAFSFSVERLGMAPVVVSCAPGPFGGEAAMFACCDNNLVIMTGFSSRHTRFKTKTPIWSTDSSDLSLPSPPIHSIFCLQQSLSEYQGHMSLMMLTGSRVFFADIWPHVGPVPRSIPLQGTPSRAIYSSTWKCFIVAHLNDGPTLSFIDPDTGSIISSPCDKDRQPCDNISGLGIPGDKIWALSEWHYIKDGKVFPFIIATTERGRLLIISVISESDERETNSPRRLLYWTRYKKKGFEEPIYSAVGDAEGLLFCVGKVLHWEVLDLAEKKLKPMKRFQLDSPATSLQVVNGKVCALTTSHSLQIIDLHVESDSTDASLIHSDQVTRYAWHSIEIGDTAEPRGKWPITLLSSAPSTIAGLWVPWGQRNKELQVSFEGTLPSNVRRFRRGHTRPLWLSAGCERRYDSLLSTVDGAEIFGACLDGSLQHFSLIGLDLWKFLRLIQNLAQLTTEVCPFLLGTQPINNVEMDSALEPRLHQNTLHINGDVLKRCLRPNTLESLTAIPDAFDLFCEYLDGINDGVFTQGFRDSPDGGRGKYIELGYDILEYLLDSPL